MKHFFQNLKNDLPAGLVVFLVALPLCLGVALASGAPLLSGVIAGIIGGLVVGIISDSHISVSGPAAGLSAVVLTAITQLNSFEVFLAAVCLAGVFQLMLGILKYGFIANYIPSNVIKGLLAAIGIILILKQIPHAIGYDATPEGHFSLEQPDGENTFSELVQMCFHQAWGAIIIAVISLLVMIFWHKTPFAKIKFFPSSLAVVFLGIGLNFIFSLYFPAFYLQGNHLVDIPSFRKLEDILNFPDFSAWNNWKLWQIAFTITIVASLETLLNLEAVENLDPEKRKASTNRELIAQGVGNLTAGLLGGIPVTSVVVRSSVNVQAGAKTKMSSIFHGFLLIFSLLFLAPYLNLIPLSSLAAILLLTGYKLAKISLFKEMYKKGMDQFIPFILTILFIVFTDLLIGVLLGLLASIFFLLKSNFKNPFILEKKERFLTDETMVFALPNQVSFLNKASIKETLWAVPEDGKVIIDASQSNFIDHDVLEVIEDFKQVAQERNIKLNIVGLSKEYHLEEQIEFISELDKETQQKLTPEQVLRILQKGNERFVKGKANKKYIKHQVNATASGQNPFAVILSCIDSRTTVEHVFDLGLGDVFSIRIAGNVLNQDILGSMEFSVQMGVKLIVVLGHSKCGAIMGACSDTKLSHLTHLLDKIQPAITEELKTKNPEISKTDWVFANEVAHKHVHLTAEKIRQDSELIAQAEKSGGIQIVCGMYDVDTGEVQFENV